MTCTKKDYIVGDLHGSYRLLMDLLEHVEFDPARDTLYSVGDLTDRGPESLACLKLLREPWFKAVLSNHEQMFLHAHTGGPMGVFWRKNGGGWSLQGNTDLIDLVDNLPVILETDDFFVIHADVSSDEPITDASIKDFDNLMHEQWDGPAVLWGRDTWEPFYGRELPAPDLAHFIETKRKHWSQVRTVYCGHTPVRQPLKLGSLHNLDTMAYKAKETGWQALTMTCHQTGQVWQARKGKVTETTFYDCVSQ